MMSWRKDDTGANRQSSIWSILDLNEHNSIGGLLWRWWKTLRRLLSRFETTHPTLIICIRGAESPNRLPAVINSMFLMTKLHQDPFRRECQSSFRVQDSNDSVEFLHCGECRNLSNGALKYSCSESHSAEVDQIAIFLEVKTANWGSPWTA